MGSDARSLGLAQMARPDWVRQLQVELESERAHHMSKARPPRMTVMSAAAALAPSVRPLPPAELRAAVCTARGLGVGVFVSLTL